MCERGDEAVHCLNSDVLGEVKSYSQVFFLGGGVTTPLTPPMICLCLALAYWRGGGRKWQHYLPFILLLEARVSLWSYRLSSVLWLAMLVYVYSFQITCTCLFIYETITFYKYRLTLLVAGSSLPLLVAWGGAVYDPPPLISRDLMRRFSKFKRHSILLNVI